MATESAKKEGRKIMRELQNGDKKLSERKKQILRAVVEAHIATGEPVGSKYLTDNAGINFSSATVRSEMADLEEMGYLEQPHTSSGRVPTKLGYHFYIDSLMNGYKLSAMETMELSNTLKGKIGELDSLMTSVSKLVSSLTNYTAVALKAENRERTVDRFSYMILDAHSFLIVMRMSDSGVVTKQIQTHVLVDDRLLKRLTQLLTKYLARTPAREISFSVVMTIEHEIGVGGARVAPPVNAADEAIGGSADADLRFEGVNRLLEYPEFSDIDKIRGMLEMMENKQEMIKILSEADSDKVNVYIGGDEQEGLVDNSALIFKKLTIGGRVVGAIGVLGPSRMDYSKVISTMEYLSRQISELFGGALPPGKTELPEDSTGKDE